MKRHLEIAKLLNISEQLAYDVLDQMFLSGIDFSQCTRKEFNSVAKECYAIIIAKR